MRTCLLAVSRLQSLSIWVWVRPPQTRHSHSGVTTTVLFAAICVAFAEVMTVLLSLQAAEGFMKEFVLVMGGCDEGGMTEDGHVWHLDSADPFSALVQAARLTGRTEALHARHARFSDPSSDCNPADDLDPALVDVAKFLLRAAYDSTVVASEKKDKKVGGGRHNKHGGTKDGESKVVRSHTVGSLARRMLAGPRGAGPGARPAGGAATLHRREQRPCPRKGQGRGRERERGQG